MVAGSGKKQLAILALLQGKDVAEAAVDARVSQRTLYYWLADDDFAAKLQAARIAAFDRSLRFLDHLSFQAAQTLANVLDDPEASPSAKVRAAGLILQTCHTSRAVEQMAEMKERLAKMEAKMEQLR